VTNNEARAIRVNVCTTFKEIEGSLEAVKNNEGLAKGIHVHDVFWEII
jgi:hypothetical protein